MKARHLPAFATSLALVAAIEAAAGAIRAGTFRQRALEIWAGDDAAATRPA